MINAFPKIFTIGQKYIHNIFEDEVEITEKVDGSQFSVAKIEGELVFRSKGKVQEVECPDKLFREGIEYLQTVKDKMPPKTQFYMEYMKKPKHNTLTYERIPKNHFALFGIKGISSEEFISDYDTLCAWAEELGIETVPLLFKGKVEDFEQMKSLLDKESILGKTKIEGFVVKNYNKVVMLGGHIVPIMCGKFVSEEFKEVHGKNWKRENTGKGKWDTFKEKYQTEARWLKAIFYLRDNGELEESPRDIGKIMKQVNLDIIEECKEEIQDFLWKEFGKDLLRQSTRGLPQWYKEYLAKESFKEKKDGE